MKRCIAIVLILIVGASLLTACSDTTPPEDTSFPASGLPSSGIPEFEEPIDPAFIVTIESVIEALQHPDEWVVIDVRTPEEFRGESQLPNAYGTGRIKGSINVERELVFDAEGELIARDELAKLYEFIGDRKVIVLCHAGRRVVLIWHILADLGYDVLSYSGSWVDWSKAASIASDNHSELVLSLTEAWTDNEGEIDIVS